MKLRNAPTFSQVSVLSFGDVEQSDRSTVEVDDVVAVWTHCVSDGDNPFATVEIRGLLGVDGQLVWLPDDAKVEVVADPSYAGQPADLIKEAVPVRAPTGAKGAVKTADGWPDLIWRSDAVFTHVMGWNDPESSVEALLCALAVVPEKADPLVRPMLLAALKARYATVSKDKRTYPPSAYPWAGRAKPRKQDLKYL